MARRSRKRDRNTPARKPRPTFRIDIELDAVVDYMTMLRGFSAHGEFYEGFVSDQLTRFPSFDGSDWEDLLPTDVSFESFLKDAIEGNSPSGKKLFKSVRPYDFAYRDLTYLRRNGAEITIHVPPTFEPYIDDIKTWSKKYFPPNSQFKPFRVVPLEAAQARKKSDVWVVRNPDSAKALKESNLPFILIDGKENAQVQGVNRVLRWDQAGFLLRHSQLIKNLSQMNRDVRDRKNPLLGPVHPPHRDLLRGKPIQLLPADDALLWIGRQLSSIEIAIGNPQWSLRHGRRSTKFRKPFSSELVRKVLPVLEMDRQEVQRKAQFLRQEIDNKMEQIFSDSDWTSILRSREEEMAKVLSDLEVELKIDPVTGGETVGRKPNIHRITTNQNLGDRLVSGDPKTPIVLQLSGAQIISLLSRHWEAIAEQIKEIDPSEISGHLAEISVALILQEGKWKLLKPEKEPNGKPSTPITDAIFSRIERVVLGRDSKLDPSNRRLDLSWHDLKTGELRTAEVDFVAKSPNGEIVIGEVKLSDPSQISNLQAELRDHIANGGRIINPGFSGVRGKTFKANWRAVVVADRDFIISAPGNDISSMSHTL